MSIWSLLVTLGACGGEPQKPVEEPPSGPSAEPTAPAHRPAAPGPSLEMFALSIEDGPWQIATWDPGTTADPVPAGRAVAIKSDLGGERFESLSTTPLPFLGPNTGWKVSVEQRPLGAPPPSLDCTNHHCAKARVSYDAARESDEVGDDCAGEKCQAATYHAAGLYSITVNEGADPSGYYCVVGTSPLYEETIFVKNEGTLHWPHAGTSPVTWSIQWVSDKCADLPNPDTVHRRIQYTVRTD